MALYLSLSSAQRGRAEEVEPALAELGDPSLSVTATLRSQLISRLLEDLSKQPWSEQTTCAAILSLKMLGRTSPGNDQLATASSMTLLLKKGGISPAPSSPPRALPPSSLESLRCLCNVLLLTESARDMFQYLPGALQGVLIILSDPAPLAVQFLAGRILFLLTVKGGDITRILVEEHQLSERLAEALGHSAITLQRPTRDDWAERTTALCEHLKVLYNVAIFYPRLLALDTGSRFTSPVPDRDSSRPSSPALDSVADSASMIRKTSSSIKGFFSSRSRNGTRSATASPNLQSPQPDTGATNQQNALSGRGFEAIVSQLAALAVGLPMDASATLPMPPLSQTLHALAEFPMSDAWLSTSPSASPLRSALPSTSLSDPKGDSLPPLPPLPARLLHLLDIATAHFCPADPDAADAVERQRSGTDVDTAVASLLLLLRKMVIGDATGTLQIALRARLLADDIDRTRPLEQRDDLTGRLIRLMGAIYLSNTKVGAGELLFALCGQDAALLSQTIGWGNAAGFLTANNLASGPAPMKQNGLDSSINPITGTVFDDSEPAGAHMTDEEKEREAERLMVLFDRLGKTGVIKVQNPMQTAQQEGRFEDLGDEGAIWVQQEEREEQEALEELRRYKERKERLRAAE